MRVSVATGNFVQKSGDRMTGQLIIDADIDPKLVMNDPNAADFWRMGWTLAAVAKGFLAYNPSTDEFSLETGAFADKVGWTVANGKQVRGIVPLARMQVDEQSASNAGAVTVTTSLTAVVLLASMNVVAGDRILYQGFMNLAKGVTAGTTSMVVDKSSGTATIQVYNTGSTAGNSHDQTASITHKLESSGIIKVTGTGTLVLRIAGVSNGSNGTVAIGDGQLYALQLQGA